MGPGVQDCTVFGGDEESGATGQQPAAVSEKAAYIQSGIRNGLSMCRRMYCHQTTTPEDYFIPSENKMKIKWYFLNQWVK